MALRWEAVPKAYIPILEKNREHDFTEQQKETWSLESREVLR